MFRMFHNSADARRCSYFELGLPVVTAAILVFQNNESAAMLVFETSPAGVELFSYVNAFFCSHKFGRKSHILVPARIFQKCAILAFSYGKSPQTAPIAVESPT